MQRFIFTPNGKEVKTGDSLIKNNVYKTPFGIITVPETIVIYKETIPALVKSKVLKPIDEHEEVYMDIQFYIDKLARKMNWTPEKTYGYLNKLDSIYPAAAFSIILREIAVELDKKYADHIQDSPEIYVISLTDEKINKMNKASIKNYRNFAAFRTLNDAIIARKIVWPVLKEMFRSTSEKN